MQRIAQKYGKRKCKKKDNKYILEEEIRHLERKLDEVNNDQVKEKYVHVKGKLSNVYKNECKGAGVRSRVKWTEDGEK